LAMLVTEGSRLADVGTDHGYVPISLMKQKRIPSAIAMDINQGPLKRADNHIAEYGLEGYIETRLSDGLDALEAGEADTVLIAGMGGSLMVRILTRGRRILHTVRELVLQPQSEIGRVRKWLTEHGYRIICEDIILEEGKYYPMMKAIPGESEEYSEEEYRYGKPELQQSLDTLQEFLQKSLRMQEQIYRSLPDSGEERIVSRRQEVVQERQYLERMLERCEGLGASSK